MKLNYLLVSLLGSCTALEASKTQFLLDDSDNDLLFNTIHLFGESGFKMTEFVEVKKIWNEVFKEFPEVEEKIEKLNEVRYKNKINKPISKPIFNIKNNWDFETKVDKYPNYKLRSKKADPSKLNFDKVKQYSGYIDNLVEDKHFFYWFFESRNDPSTDPVVLWINGGPGCSSFTGLMFELGPSLMTFNGTIEYNEDSWNSNASMIFLDQPVGTGFSYSNGDSVGDSWVAAEDVFVFLDLFFEQFPEYKNLDFHISGESYAGIYIPLIAKEILSHEEKSFNLTSIIIGNGITDPKIQYNYYQPMLCGKGGYPQVIPDERCDKLETEMSRCEKLVDACYFSKSKFACLPAMIYCEGKVSSAVSDYHINSYDISMVCDECYPEQSYITNFLNLPDVQEALGSEVSTFSSCSSDVFNKFLLSADQLYPYQEVIQELLDVYDLPILLFSGDLDYICNWLGNEAWINELPYSQHDLFIYAPYRKFIDSTGYHAGNVKNFDKLTFMKIFDAGHMVPYYQKTASLDMLNRWISGDYSLTK